MSLKKIKSIFKITKNKSEALKQARIGHYELIAPSEHPIEYHLRDNKYYCLNLSRIAKYIEQKYQLYTIIDIGANIGDTIALFRTANVNQQIFAVEGEPFYFDLLKRNVSQFTNVKIFEAFLGEKTQMEELSIEAIKGTAKLNTAKSKLTQIIKLDDFISEHRIDNVKLLKIDTDGFDLKILRGGLEFIKISKPILFFEYDASYLEEHGENGVSIFENLHDLGYQKVLYYDNYGKFLISISIDDTVSINQLYAYIRNGEGAFEYYDLCIFHKDDSELAGVVIKNEMDFFS